MFSSQEKALSFHCFFPLEYFVLNQGSSREQCSETVISITESCVFNAMLLEALSITGIITDFQPCPICTEILPNSLNLLMSIAGDEIFKVYTEEYYSETILTF